MKVSAPRLAIAETLRRSYPLDLYLFWRKPKASSVASGSDIEVRLMILRNFLPVKAEGYFSGLNWLKLSRKSVLGEPLWGKVNTLSILTIPVLSLCSFTKEIVEAPIHIPIEYFIYLLFLKFLFSFS